MSIVYRKKKGAGLLNTLINKLPFEMHIPSYNYCGPGTKLSKRLARGDAGINELDEACKQHDIAYSKSKDIKERHRADRVLEEHAWRRYKAPDAKFGERVSALGVTGAMKVKRKLGMGFKKRRRARRKHRGRGLGLNKAIQVARKELQNKEIKSIKSGVQTALRAIKKRGRVLPVKKQRIIPIPKSGGFLPLIPLFAGLSALGALGGGAAGIAKAVNDAKSATQKLAEAKRHNKAMEAIAVGKQGSGLFLKPYKSGCGLYMKPFSKNC